MSEVGIRTDGAAGEHPRLRALGLHRRELRAWAMYDWANSAFATTVMAAVLPIYYVRVAAADRPPNVALAYWSYTASVSLLLIAIASPVLGAMADYLGAKKRFLAGFVGLGVVGTACLYFVSRGDWLLASICFLVGNAGFAGSIIFSDGLLPHIARADEIDRVSAGGWALGYVGGGLLLLINLIMIQRPGLFGFADAAAATRAAFVTVAVWWAAFSVPILRSVPEPPRRLQAAEALHANAIRVAFRRLHETVGEIREYREVVTMLVAFWFYSDGIGTIIKVAAAYATSIGIIGEASLLGALLFVQLVGIPFTFLFGTLGDRIGAKSGIYLALGIYVLIAMLGYFMTRAWHVWALAFGIGMVQGGAQALSRSLYATMIPRTRSAEFFGFFSVFEKFAGIAGPALFGLVSQLTGTGRLGILSLLVFFLGGILLLTRVDVKEGRRVARLENAKLAPASTPSPPIL
ncbi:MAG: MFS transporter [Gemmatimonadetes bacterium]|nr:MFS transporter [Gemmatimonadota bacterium]